MMKHDWLIAEAKKWVGTVETAPNRGPIVDHFIKETGGALGAAWCASFARYCCDQVDKRAQEIFVLEPDLHLPNNLDKTQMALRLWEKSPEHSRSLSPVPGYIAVWRHYDANGHATGMGHVGIVTKVIDGGRWFETVEGNCGPDSHGEINREGDGVYEKIRSAQGGPKFRYLGSFDPWFLETPKIMP